MQTFEDERSPMIFKSLHIKKTSPKKRVSRKKSGMKSITKEIMTAYKREIAHINKQKKCKIPSIAEFTRKHLKGIRSRKHHSKLAKETKSSPESEVSASPAESEEVVSSPESEEVVSPAESEEVVAPAESEEVVASPKPEENSIASTLSSINPFSQSESEKKTGGKKSSRKHRKSSRKQK